MTRKALALFLFLIASLPLFAADPLCPEQKNGTTSDNDPVVVCQKLFASAPYVHVPADQHAADGSATINGVLEMDIRQRPDTKTYKVSKVGLYDRNLTHYDLVDAAGKPLDETSAILLHAHMPSNRPHFLIYEAKGKVAGKRLQLTGLRPVVLVEGHAIDERFLGVWEGVVSKRRADDKWYTDIDNAEHVAKVRITFAAPLTPHENIGVLDPTPKLPDGTRFEALGRFDNATKPIRLSTGECAPPMNSYGAANPFPDRVATKDYSLTLWRFPAMHSLSSEDFHIVFDYPKGLHPAARAMARDHNFRLKDYIATSTQPKALVFGIHGNPVDQILFSLKPVQGGGGACQ